MYNATSRKEIRRAEKVFEQEEKKRVNFVVAAMSTSEGRLWFHDLLSNCRVFADRFSGDALHEAYSKGERNIGLRIYGDIVSNCPDYFVTMMKEATLREQINAQRSSHDTPDDAGEPAPDAYDPYSDPTDGERPAGEDANR